MLAFEAELAHLARSLIAAIWEVSDKFLTMIWRPSTDIDVEVRQRMKAKGWEVSRVNSILSENCTPGVTMCAGGHHQPSAYPPCSRELPCFGGALSSRPAQGRSGDAPAS